jgi:hypothetical protein
MTTAAIKVLGINYQIGKCDCCEREELQCTVELSINGAAVNYGRGCAARALYGRRSTKHIQTVETQARAMSKVRPVVEAVRNALPQGLAAAIEAGRTVGKTVRINGADVLVNGFASWGQINVDWNGGREVVPLQA